MVSGRISYLCRRCGEEWQTELIEDLEIEFAYALTSDPRASHDCGDGVWGVSDLLAAYPIDVA